MKKNIILIILTILLILQFGCSGEDYKKAQQLFDQEQYAEAEAAFIELGDYKDSEAMVTECKYQRAIILYAPSEEASTQSQSSTMTVGAFYDAKKIEEYEKALSLFEEIADYKDSIDYISNCKVKICQKLIGEIQYGAYDEFLFIKDPTQKDVNAAKKAKDYFDSLTTIEKERVVNRSSLPSDEAIEEAEKQLLLDSLETKVLDEAVKKLKSSLINSSSYQDNPDHKHFVFASWSETEPNEAYGLFTLYYSATNSYGGRVDSSQHGMFRAQYEDGYFTITEMYFTDY